MNIQKVNIAEKINPFRDHSNRGVDVNKDGLIMVPWRVEHRLFADTKTEILSYEGSPALNTDDRRKEDFQKI